MKDNSLDNQFSEPEFWNEEWLRSALDRLDMRKMSSAELLRYHASLTPNAQAVSVAQRARSKALDEGFEQGARQATAAVVQALLQLDILSIEQLMQASRLSQDDVVKLKAELTDKPR